MALDGRDGGRPLTSVAAAPEPPAEPLVEALAERVASAPRGLIVAGRISDRSAVEAIAALARATGYPLLAEPTSQLRLGPHDRGLVISRYEPVARARPQQLTPELVLRFGEMPTCKPLRGWLADLPEAAQLVIDPDRGWNEPTRIAGAIVRADPARLAAALTERADGALDPAWARAWLAASEAADEAIEAELAELTEATEPGVHAALGRELRRRRPRLHRLEHADPRSGGVPGRRPRRGPLPRQPGRERDRRADLLRDRRRGGVAAVPPGS